MNWSIPQLVAILDVEIQWCKEHHNPALSIDYEFGFVKGLEQAQYILRCAENPKLMARKIIAEIHGEAPDPMNLKYDQREAKLTE